MAHELAPSDTARGSRGRGMRTVPWRILCLFFFSFHIYITDHWLRYVIPMKITIKKVKIKANYRHRHKLGNLLRPHARTHLQPRRNRRTGT